MSLEALSARIRQLPPEVADAIAAGEVVERPASVLKELCENALDARARRIDAAVEGGGLVRLSVRDDGEGIAGEELPLAVARHATSKISAAADLERVRTLGFRGEALASIAAVSELRITSRRAVDDVAWTLRVRGSALQEQGPAAGAPGTTVEVCDLFYATPARLRFLRSERTETALALRAVSDCALTAPRVAVSCTVDGRVVLRSGGGGLEDALRAVYGGAAGELRPLDQDDGALRIGGAISEPRAHRGTRGGLVLVVNGRRVQQRALAAAVEEAYRGLLPAGRYPFGVVTVELDPHELDVNVHPAKREVRFRDERRVFGAVARACAAVTGGARVYGFSPQPAPLDGDLLLRAAGWELPAPPPGENLVLQEVAVPPALDAAGGAAELAPLRALGQVLDSWIVAASPSGVVIVDQHAAHEKVLYTALLQAATAEPAEQAPSQLLLMPELIEADAMQLAALDSALETTRRLGFELEPFGPSTVRCTAVPARGRSTDAARLVAALLDELADPQGRGQRDHRLCALVACHTAVRAGDPLGVAEQQQLLDELQRTPGAATCPHGRPALMLLDDRTLRRGFRRPLEP